MIDEGYIKFNASWKKTEPLDFLGFDTLNHFRQLMYQNNWIGVYPDGIGFGNISIRKEQSNQFYISGSKTGNLKTLDNSHYSLVSKVFIHENRLECQGSSIASSESMSHAVIFQQCDWVNGVIHIHSLSLWERLLHKVPTTTKGIPYGTPEMAYSIIDLLENTDLKTQKIFVMEGHQEGIFAFGKDLEEAAQILFNISNIQ